MGGRASLVSGVEPLDGVGVAGVRKMLPAGYTDSR
jgi:hypothetical protein